VMAGSQMRYDFTVANTRKSSEPESESWSVRTPRQFTSPPKTVRKSQENRQIKDPRKKHFPAILNSSVKIITFNIENLGRNT